MTCESVGGSLSTETGVTRWSLGRHCVCAPQVFCLCPYDHANGSFHTNSGPSSLCHAYFLGEKKNLLKTCKKNHIAWLAYNIWIKKNVWHYGLNLISLGIKCFMKSVHTFSFVSWYRSITLKKTKKKNSSRYCQNIQQNCSPHLE